MLPGEVGGTRQCDLLTAVVDQRARLYHRWSSQHPADCCTAAAREGRSYIELVAEGQQQDKLLWTSQGMREWRTEDNIQDWIRSASQNLETGQM